MPGAEILIHHQKVGVVGGRLVGAGQLRQVVVRECHGPTRVEPMDHVAQRTEIGDASRSARGALVRDTPAEDTRMVAGLFDHFPHLLLRQLHHARIRQLRLAELPDGNFRNEEDAVPVRIIQDERILRVVDGASERRVERSHVVPVVSHGPCGFSQPFPWGILVPGNSGKTYSLTVDQQMSIADL